MSELLPSQIAEIVASCKSGLAETLQTLGRTFEATFTGEVGEPTPLDLAAPEFAEPGLVILLGVGTNAALAVIPESSGFLPAWIDAPDADGASKLTTLAQELGLLLLPETLIVDDFRALRVERTATALLQADPAANAQVVPITLTAADGRQGKMSLNVSFLNGLSLFQPTTSDLSDLGERAADADDLEDGPAGVLRGAAADAAFQDAAPAFGVPPRSLDELPPYSRSLLKIKVPVMVTLAGKKYPLSKIVEIGPGTMIQFKKSCDQTLELEANGQIIGEGEAVKVGEKFGIRVTSMKLPGERFHAVTPTPRR